MQTSGSHGRYVLLRVEDSGEEFVICNKHKIMPIQIRVKLTHNPDDGEGFFVDLRVVSLRSRQRSQCKSDRAFGAVWKHVRHHCADAVRLGIARRRVRAGLKWVSTKSKAICCFTLPKAWWQAAVHIHAVSFCISVFRG